MFKVPTLWEWLQQLPKLTPFPQPAGSQPLSLPTSNIGTQAMGTAQGFQGSAPPPPVPPPGTPTPRAGTPRTVGTRTTAQPGPGPDPSKGQWYPYPTPAPYYVQGLRPGGVDPAADVRAEQITPETPEGSLTITQWDMLSLEEKKTLFDAGYTYDVKRGVYVPSTAPAAPLPLGATAAQMLANGWVQRGGQWVQGWANQGWTSWQSHPQYFQTQQAYQTWLRRHEKDRKRGEDERPEGGSVSGTTVASSTLGTG